jgi:hypothetical protein
MAMNNRTAHNTTFPHGFLDFLKVSQERRRSVGAYELQPSGLARFNRALRELSPQAPQLTMDQVAGAAERVLLRHADGSTPPFVASRMLALARLQAMLADPGWSADITARRLVQTLQAYRDDAGDLIPDALPVVGLLDDAVLVDVALQLLHHEVGDYEDFCRFRKVAADFSGMTEVETGLTRPQWLEAMLQAHSDGDRPVRPQRYVPDPRVSLFHIG